MFGFGKPSDKDITEFAGRAVRRSQMLAATLGKEQAMQAQNPAVAQEMLKDYERSLRDIYARTKDWDKAKKEFAEARGMKWPV